MQGKRLARSKSINSTPKDTIQKDHNLPPFHTISFQVNTCHDFLGEVGEVAIISLQYILID